MAEHPAATGGEGHPGGTGELVHSEGGWQAGGAAAGASGLLADIAAEASPGAAAAVAGADPWPSTPQRPPRTRNRPPPRGGAAEDAQPLQQSRGSPKKGRTPPTRTPQTATGSAGSASASGRRRDPFADSEDEDESLVDIPPSTVDGEASVGPRGMLEDFEDATNATSDWGTAGYGSGAGKGGCGGRGAGRAGVVRGGYRDAGRPDSWVHPGTKTPTRAPYRSPGGAGAGAASFRHDGRPPPPPAGSIKALPPDQVQRFLGLVQEGDHEEALKALRKVRRSVKGRGCSKEAFGGLRALLHHLLEGYASAGRLTEALELLQEMKRGTEARLVSAAAFNALLRGLLARGALGEARFLVRQMMARMSVQPNEASLNLLMDTAARAGPQHLDEAWDVLEEMQQRGLRADKYTVSILTKGISDRSAEKRPARGGALRGVALVEKFLTTQPEDVDEVLVNSLLDVFCRMGDMQRLEATLQKMREYGIRGSAVTYGTVVKAYGRAGNIDKVLQAWEEMSEEGLEANAVTYGCMLDACVKCGHLDKALAVFATMKGKGLHRNTILYATLIKGFAKSKDPAAARNLHREMVDEGVLCNVVVFNSLIDACVRANDLHGAAEVLTQMTAAGVKPDLITFSTLIKGYCSNGELSKAMRLADELAARNLECDEIVYNSLLEGCVKAGDLQLGLRLFGEMRQRGVRPSSVTFSILVKLLARAGRLDLACQLVSHEMRDMHGVAPTRMVWSCLVTCAVKARDLAKAGAALELLDQEGGAAGPARASMYATVIEGCLMQGEVSLSLELCERAYCRAPAEEGPRGLISMDLLRRVFEAAGSRSCYEAEARSVLQNVSRLLPEQARASLGDALNRGSRRRNSPPPGRGRADGPLVSGYACGGSTSPAPPPQPGGLVGVLKEAAQHATGSAPASAASGGSGAAGAGSWQWSPSQLHAGQAFGGCEAAISSGMPWDPSFAAALSAAGWGWPAAAADGYGMYGYGAEDCYGAWPYQQQGSWDDGYWAALAAGAGSALGEAGGGCGSFDPSALEAPETPGAAAGSGSAGAPSQCGGTPGPSGKAQEYTPATTAGRSPPPISPGEDDLAHGRRGADDDSPSVQVRLFEHPLGPGGLGDGDATEAALNSTIVGPPGLC